MIQLYDAKAHCCGCTACMNICPHRAIQMIEDEEGFLYPKINRNLCVECGACLRVCSFHKTEYQNKIPYDQEVYAVKHQNLNIRKISTSGGAFTAISDYVLEHKGVVYGAVYSDRFEVIHSSALTKAQRDRMRGSKYVQSKLETIFKEIRVYLESGKLVLFVGTPCQNGGLKSYLGSKEYDNLILCDIVCHGVPSPKIWRDYKKYLEEKYKDKIQDINFRCKESGWRNSSIKVKFENKVYLQSMQEDPFYVLFFSHLSIRPSCHECIYACYHRITDITLADFWGIEDTEKTFSDNIGVSLLLVNTRKGKDLFEHIENQISYVKSNHSNFYQPIFDAPSKMSSKRSIFWNEYLNMKNDVNNIILKYGKLTITQKIIKRVIVPILKKTGLYKFAEKVYFRQ